MHHAHSFYIVLFYHVFSIYWEGKRLTLTRRLHDSRGLELCTGYEEDAPYDRVHVCVIVSSVVFGCL